jgi:hypothetical protein
MDRNAFNNKNKKLKILYSYKDITSTFRRKAENRPNYDRIVVESLSMQLRLFFDCGQVSVSAREH